jgi:cell surface protein SprA
MVDPSSDDFHYYIDDSVTNNLGILERYKYYANPEGNSKASSSNVVSSTSIPNTEDINNDNTLSQTESFFQYQVQLAPGQLKTGSNFIVDSVQVPKFSFPNHTSSAETWYQFRIPIENYQKIVGSIQDFKTIRFMRMFLTGFKDSVILRFARLQLVRGEWRKSDQNLKIGGENNSSPAQNEGSFNISAINIENNSTQTPVNYVLPPGISRQSDPSNPQLAQLNEQSMVLNVTGLANGDARAAYKTCNLDIRNYKHLIMDVHAEAVPPDQTLHNGDLSVFLQWDRMI